MWATAAWAQAGAGIPPAAARSMSVPGVPATKLYEVKPNGKKVETSDYVLRYQTEVLTQDETAEALLDRHRWAKHPKTMAMLQAMNPALDISKPLKAGDQVVVYTLLNDMKEAERPKVMVPDSPNLAGLTLLGKKAEANRNLVFAKQLPTSAFLNADLQKRHLQSIEDVKVASDKIGKKADHLSVLDYNLAQYQVELANKYAEDVNTKARLGKLTDNDVTRSMQAAGNARVLGDRAAAGEQISGRRLVRVNVYKAESDQHVPALAVYAYPAGIATFDFGQATTENYLRILSFTNDTSPVSQQVPSDFDVHLCVGPKNSVREMAKLIREKRVDTCRRLNFADPALITMTFRSPSDIAKP
jgi:hypothetical protein